MEKRYATVTPYLIIENALQFFEFTKNVFGAEEIERKMRDEKILQHGEIMINESVIMFADAVKDYPPYPAGLFVIVNNADETYQKAIDNGAAVVQELRDLDYGRSGGVKDICGVTWWITSGIK